MKKVLKIILINFILLLLVAFIFEIIFYLYSLYEYNRYYDSWHFEKDKNDLTYNINLEYFNDNFFIDEFRKPSGLPFKKKPILLFGCSFTQGAGLKDNETFSYKLSEYTKRPVYNRGYVGGGIQHSIIQAEGNDLYKEVKNPEYIIFLYNSYLHIPRIYHHVFFLYDKYLYPAYIITNNKLTRKPRGSFVEGTYIYKTIKKIEEHYKANSFSPKTQHFVLMHFEKLREEIQKHWKNPKFVILFYNEGIEPPNNFDNELKKKLEKDGFIVLDTYDLTGVYFDEAYHFSEYDCHPSAKVWDIVVPKLAEKLKL